MQNVPQEVISGFSGTFLSIGGLMYSIRLTENYEIRRHDSMNWRMWRRKEITKGKRRGEMDWVPQEAYFGNIEAALGHLMRDHALNGDKEKTDVKGAIANFRRLENEIKSHAKEFREGMAKQKEVG